MEMENVRNQIAQESSSGTRYKHQGLFFDMDTIHLIDDYT